MTNIKKLYLKGQKYFHIKKNDTVLFCCENKTATVCAQNMTSEIKKKLQKRKNYIYLNVCILLGISPASDENCSMPTFRNTLSVPSSKAGCEV